MKKTFIKILGVAITMIIISGTLMPAPMTSAQVKDYTLLEPLPCIPGAGQSATDCAGGNLITKVNINTYIGYIFKLAIALAAFLAVFMFTVGGFQYMLSEAVTSKGEARDRMTNAILGLLAAIFSYLILYTIDPKLVQLSVVVPDLKLAKKTTLGGLDAALNSTDAKALNTRASNFETLADEIDAELATSNDISEEKSLAMIAEAQSLRDAAQRARSEAIFVSAIGEADAVLVKSYPADSLGIVISSFSVKDARAKIETVMTEKLKSLTSSSDADLYIKLQDARLYYDSFITYMFLTQDSSNKLKVMNPKDKPSVEAGIRYVEDQKSKIVADFERVSATITEPIILQKLTLEKNRSVNAINTLISNISK